MGKKKSKCTPCWRPVASLDWKSNCLTNITNVMNNKDGGVFYWTPALGGTCTSGKNCALEPERQNFLCVSPVLFSLHLLYSLPANQLSQLLKTIGDMWPIICILQFQSNSVAWPSWLQFQIPEREKKNLIGSALLMIPGLVQRAMTRAYAMQWKCRFWRQLPEKREVTGNLAGIWKIETIIIFHKWDSAHFPLQMGFWENNKCWVPMTC